MLIVGYGTLNLETFTLIALTTLGSLGFLGVKMCFFDFDAK